MFIISWHELLIPLILNDRADFMTLPVVIASLVGDVFVFFNLTMAICLLALAADGGAGAAAAEVHRRGLVGRRSEGLTAGCGLPYALTVSIDTAQRKRRYVRTC